MPATVRRRGVLDIVSRMQLLPIIQNAPRRLDVHAAHSPAPLIVTSCCLSTSACVSSSSAAVAACSSLTHGSPTASPSAATPPSTSNSPSAVAGVLRTVTCPKHRCRCQGVALLVELPATVRRRGVLDIVSRMQLLPIIQNAPRRLDVHAAHSPAPLIVTSCCLSTSACVSSSSAAVAACSSLTHGSPTASPSAATPPSTSNSPSAVAGVLRTVTCCASAAMAPASLSCFSSSAAAATARVSASRLRILAWSGFGRSDQ